MPMIDMRCGACEQEFEVLVGGPNQFEAPKECPDCGAGCLCRLWTFDGSVSTTKFVTPTEAQFHLRHARDIEKQARDGKLDSVTERGPLEFRPKIERRLH